MKNISFVDVDPANMRFPRPARTPRRSTETVRAAVGRRRRRNGSEKNADTKRAHPILHPLIRRRSSADVTSGARRTPHLYLRRRPAKSARRWRTQAVEWLRHFKSEALRPEAARRRTEVVHERVRLAHMVRSRSAVDATASALEAVLAPPLPSHKDSSDK